MNQLMAQMLGDRSEVEASRAQSLSRSTAGTYAGRVNGRPVVQLVTGDRVYGSEASLVSNAATPIGATIAVTRPQGGQPSFDVRVR